MMQRKKRNSSKVNLVVSIVLHVVLGLASVFWAAREGYLGKKMGQITAFKWNEEKAAEKPKVKEPEVKKAETKETKPAETAKVTAPPAAKASTVAAPTATAAAPPPSTVAAFDFSDGAKVKQSESPTELYKGLLESSIRTRWIRPDNLDDKEFIAEVELSIDPSGRITGNEWKKGSGNKKWDDSVREVLAQTKAMSRPPPKDFPGKFIVRFDVQSDTEPLLSASLK